MRSLRRIRWWLTAFTVLDACLLGAAFLVMRFGHEVVWPTSLIVMLPQWLWMVPPALTLGVCLLIRAWPAAGLNAALLGAAAIALSGCAFATGSPVSGETAPRTVRCVTWNVHNGKRHLDEIRRKLLELEPDVVCLQEAFDPRFTELIPGWSHVDALGVRVQSRFPVVEAGWLGRTSNGYCPWAACEITTPAGDLVVLNVHFSKAMAGDVIERHTGDLAGYFAQMVVRRMNQVDVVLAALPGSRPTVVAGDFNTPPNSSLHRALARRMTDCYAATRFGFGYTFLVGRLVPSWRIDYVWAANGVRPVSVRLGHAYPSDHRPLVADVALPAAGQVAR